MAAFFDLPRLVLTGIFECLTWQEVETMRLVCTASCNWIDRNRKYLPRKSIKMELCSVKNTSNLFLLIISGNSSSKRIILAKRTIEPKYCENEGLHDIFSSGSDTCYIVVRSVTSFLDLFMPILLWKVKLKRLKLSRIDESILEWFTDYCSRTKSTVPELRIFPYDVSAGILLKFLLALRPSKLLLELSNCLFLEELLLSPIIQQCSHLYLDVNDHEDVVFNLKMNTLPQLRAVNLEIMQKVVIGNDCLREIIKQWMLNQRSFEKEWTFIVERNILEEMEVFRDFKYVRHRLPNERNTSTAIHYFTVQRSETDFLNIFWKQYVLLLNPSEQRINSVMKLCR